MIQIIIVVVVRFVLVVVTVVIEVLALMSVFVFVLFLLCFPALGIVLPVIMIFPFVMRITLPVSVVE